MLWYESPDLIDIGISVQDDTSTLPSREANGHLARLQYILVIHDSRESVEFGDKGHEHLLGSIDHPGTLGETQEKMRGINSAAVHAKMIDEVIAVDKTERAYGTDGLVVAEGDARYGVLACSANRLRDEEDQPTVAIGGGIVRSHPYLRRLDALILHLPSPV